MKKTKYILPLFFLIGISIMSIGYSLLATNLTLDANSEIVGEWDVRITNMKAIQVSPGCDAGNPMFTDTTMGFYAKLVKPGDSITYEITIENKGTMDAKLETIDITPDEENGSERLHYENTTPATQLKKGETTKFTITVTYDTSSTEIPETKSKAITGTIEYVQT